MSVRQAAELARPRVMAFLQDLAAILRGKGLDVPEPAELSEPESHTWMWGIVVHLWPTPPGELPPDSLDVWVLLPHFKDGRITRVDFAVQFVTVEGTVIADYEVDEHGLAESRDRLFIEEKLRALESPEMLRKAANEVLKYVEENRRHPRRPMPPKEWSPRWRRPKMGAAEPPRFRPIKFNLVERPEWKERWEPGDVYLSQASDLAWDYVKHMDELKLENIIGEVAGELFQPSIVRGPKDWTPREKIRETLDFDDIELIRKGFQKQHPLLEGLRQLILDTATSMYEDALGPRDDDIRSALDNTKEKFEEKRRYDLDWDLWGPLLETGVTAQGILREMVGRAVRYDRNQGAYDRFLVFDQGLSGAPVELLARIPPQEHTDTVRALNSEWKDLANSFMGDFFQMLEKEMKDIDVDNRIEWKPAWKTALKSADLKGVRKALLDYAREARQEGGAA